MTALSLYLGKVMHARMRPVAHRFTYRVYSILVDVDRLPEADRLSPVFSVDRWNLLSFHRRDHGPRDGSDLRAHVERLLPTPPAQIRLLCYPRVLGFVFNPLSVYYCSDDAGRLTALIYEVRNTFGQAHSYVAPIAESDRCGAEVRQARDKLFYVSPFLDMELRYRFRLQAPDETLRLRILETGAQGPILAAAFSAQRRPATTRGFLAAFGAVPLLTFKVVAAIHWEALRLFLKGLRLVPRPAPPRSASFGEARPLSDAHP